MKEAVFPLSSGKSSRIACLVVEAVASLTGLLLLVLCWFGSSHSLFFPEHRVHRIRVPDPSSQEMEDNLLEATSKGQSCQPLLPVFRFWYATSCLEKGWTGRVFLMGLGPVTGQFLLRSDTTCPREQLAVTHPVIAGGGGGKVHFFPSWLIPGLPCDGSMGRRERLDYSFRVWVYFSQNREY